ncbi:MAG: VOC family protein [Chloroflexota bacterium]|nr:VOC family protein [Chloroflexota bacterium]
MPITHRITPSLWFDNNAEEAANLYVSLFPNSRIASVVPIPSGPAEGGAVVDFELDGMAFNAFDGGPMFPHTNAVSFTVSCKDQAEIDHYWNGLLEGGGVEEQCGWLRDRFGLSWQIQPAALGELIEANPEAVMNALFQMVKIDIETLRRAADRS